MNKNITLKDINGIGEKKLEYLKKLKINNLFSLLLHLPTHYTDMSIVTPICMIENEKEYCIEGEITKVLGVSVGKLKTFSFKIADRTGEIKVTYFNLPNYLDKSFVPRTKIRLFGKITFFQGFPQLNNPIRIQDDNVKYFSPNYPLTSGIKIFEFKKIISKALEFIDDDAFEELIPPELNPFKITLKNSLQNIHQASIKNDIISFNTRSSVYHERLKYEELVAHNLSILYLKNSIKNQKSKIIKKVPKTIDDFIKTLPFTPTNGQMEAFKDISNDLNSNIPMNRLVQGDVGCGKTLVSVLTALQVVANGYQVAIMTPTEILATQHYENISKLLKTFGFSICLLTGKQKKKEKDENIRKIESGDVSIIIGTHSIFQEDVIYKNLRLIIIDEQHRFGVEQRLSLRLKCTDRKIIPHLLAMTATPIPRTLSQIFYADMSISVINELPPNRHPVKTSTLSINKIDMLIPRIHEHTMKGKQIFWVCCLIDESDKINCQDVTSRYEYLKNKLPNEKIGVIHGRMKSSEKDEIMNSFKNGELDILVSTSIIEVGVDVPNAFLIVIENAERYGLAQLHQLRGRVGRGKHESFCMLLYSNETSSLGMTRLNILKESNDGFFISKKDLEIRGPGDILGTRQIGELSFKVANIMDDAHLYENAKQTAYTIFEKHPNLVNKIIDRWFPYNSNIEVIS